MGTAIVLDGANAWVAGLTASTNFPVSATPYESTNDAEVMAGPPATTGFVTELTPSSTSGLSQIDYSTYFGGTGFSVTIPLLGTFGTGDAIGAMAESGGKVYVTGLTTSASALETGYTSTFPTTSNNCQASNNSSGISLEGFSVPITAFVSELNPSAAATQLVFSTLLGGSGMADIGLGLAFNSAGNDIYVVGSTYSTDFPVTSNAYQLFNNDFNTQQIGTEHRGVPDGGQSCGQYVPDAIHEADSDRDRDRRYSDGDSDRHSDGNCDRDRRYSDGDGDRNQDRDRNGDRDCDRRHSDSDRNRDQDCDGNGYGDCDSNGHRNRFPARDSNCDRDRVGDSHRLPPRPRRRPAPLQRQPQLRQRR